MRHFINIITEASVVELPMTLRQLATEIGGKSYEAAKRAMVAKVGSVGSRERFDDDVADAVFARYQRNAQVGRYGSEEEINRLGRSARRLEGDGTVELYRAAPKGGGIRPGDFCAGSKHEAGFYRHGGHVVQKRIVPRHDVVAVDGSSGGGQEYVYLPLGYSEPAVQEWFASFREFYDAAVSGI